MGQLEFRGVELEVFAGVGDGRDSVCAAAGCFAGMGSSLVCTTFPRYKDSSYHFCPKHMAAVEAYVEPPLEIPTASVKADVERQRRFASHQIDADQSARADDIRHACLVLSEKIAKRVPAGREQSVALTNLEQVMFFAVAGICREVKA